MERINLFYKRKKISLKAEKVYGLRKLFGLMFKNRNSRNILFKFNKDSDVSLTSLFVFFPFLVLWLDERNNILDFRIARPFKFLIRTKGNFRKIVEIPCNEENSEIVDLFVGKRKI